MQLGLGEDGAELFNLETSNGECDKSSEGRVSRTKVRRGAELRAKQLREDEAYSFLLYVSWCGLRYERWPTAKDSETALRAIREEFNRVYDTPESFKLFNKTIGRLGPNWCDKAVKDEVKALQGQYDQYLASRISQSPLFAKLHKSYPYLDPDSFDEEYDRKGQNFSATAISLLRDHLRENRPEELNHVTSWNRSWLQHLPYYQEQWLNETKRLERVMKTEQSKWLEGLMSLPTQNSEFM